MTIPDKKIQQLDTLLDDLDFPQLYKEYRWMNDTYRSGFPDMYRLEKEISDAAKNNRIAQHHLVEIAKWGKLRNTRNISCEEPLDLGLYMNGNLTPDLVLKPVTSIRKIDAKVKGFGPTYASKLLHFAVPQVFGALDTRLVRIFGNAAPEYHLLDLDAEKCSGRWLIPQDQKGWPGEFGTWTAILNYLAERLNKTGHICPHPEKFIENHLREKGIWLPADVETALFSYASLQIDPVPGELERLIGYTFRNKKRLMEATTRRAYINENPSQGECMDPLSTFGDAVLDAVAVYRLYNAGVRTQGELTIFKSNQVKREKTHAFAQKNHLEKYIRWGDGEFKQKIWEQGQEAFDAVTEAIIGAIFLDAQKSEKNGFEIVEKFLGETDFFEKDSR